MKSSIAFFALILLLALAGCKKLPDGWTKEELNDDLTIGFPDTYTGAGRLPTIEGYIFSKRREDGKVVFAIGGVTYFLNYGATIQKPLPDTYGRFDSYQNVFRKGKRQGRYYYIEDNGASLRQSEGLYLIKRKGGDYSVVIGTSHSQDTHGEVIEILKNIRKK